MYEDQDTSPVAVVNGDAGNHLEQVAVEASAVAIMERVQIDTQIATAKQYPRSLAKFIQRAQEMATVDEETAASCIYRRPVGKKNGKEVYAEGESIRLAEIVAACYGNLRVQGMIVEVGLRQVRAVGACHDLESNYAAKAEAVESTVTQYGKPFSERMRLVVAKAAQSKAIRDAVFRVVPKSLCKSITRLAKDVALGKGLSLQQRRSRVLDWIVSLEIDVDRVWQAMAIEGVEELGNDQLLILTGLRTAINDGDITKDEAFPVESPTGPETQTPTKGNEAVKQQLAGNGKTPTGPDTPTIKAELAAKAKAAKAKVNARREQPKPEPDVDPEDESDVDPEDESDNVPDSEPNVEEEKAAAGPSTKAVKLVAPNVECAPERNAAYGKLACVKCKRTFDLVSQVGERYYCPYCGTGRPIVTDGYEGEDLMTLADSQVNPGQRVPEPQQWHCDQNHTFAEGEIRPSAKTPNGLCPKCLSNKIERGSKCC